MIQTGTRSRAGRLAWRHVTPSDRQQVLLVVRRWVVAACGRLGPTPDAEGCVDSGQDVERRAGTRHGEQRHDARPTWSGGGDTSKAQATASAMVTR